MGRHQVAEAAPVGRGLPAYLPGADHPFRPLRFYLTLCIALFSAR